MKSRITNVIWVFVFVGLMVAWSVEGFDLEMKFKEDDKLQSRDVIIGDELQQDFNSTVYENGAICTNGMLKLIEFDANKTQEQLIYFSHNSAIPINASQIIISSSPNISPLPFVSSSTNTSFTLSSGCALLPNITNQNYYNQIKISLTNISSISHTGSYQFSFLINCDSQNRHKKFQYGYLLIGLINAAITIGVALHSRIWSIKINQKPLRILLTWKLFLLIMIILIAVGITFYFVANKEFKLANLIIKYLGLVVSLVFTFICMNEVLYLFRPFKKPLWTTTCYIVRRCEIGSLIFAVSLFIVSLFVENWILYTFLAGCICVGSIKMLYFNSMQQAFYSLAISVCSVTLIAVVLHFILPRSYNDYASELSSPLFIQVPDLVDNLFKKCSWLPVVDIIVPGVFLSFLRTYDENFTTGWGGVYTVIGNLTFLLATTLWIGIEALYPFSVPFSLITYTLLLLSISVIAFKRNQLKTLWGGYFLQQNDISSGLLREDEKARNSIDEETWNAIKIGQSFSSKGDQEEQHQYPYHQELTNPKVSKSAFRTKRQVSKDIKTRKSSPSKYANPFSSSIK